MKASKVAYKPVGMALGALSGVVAGGLFKQVWKKKLGRDEDALDVTDDAWTQNASPPPCWPASA
ncbi:DUF4235 domain-containing protein [Streptomyces sp. AC555_RSS877]|uniref:DUF4235 domain-containing protein n=1 Tax=Streptomyces sp. AC555_RSS877 TaxID=2823688 RepID=UPI001C26A1C5